MKIEILSSVMISGESVEAGSFIEVNAADANLLIGMNKARIALEPEPQPEPEAPKRSRKNTQSTSEEG
jgi:hypothetical protein